MMINSRKAIGTIAHMPLGLRGAEEFHWSWAQMVEFNADYLCGPTERIFYTRAMVTYHAFARDQLAKTMRGDWLLMLDTDHQFEPDLALRMLTVFERHDLDVLSGLYVYKSAPHAPVIFARGEAGGLGVIGKWDSPPDGDGPHVVQISSAGAGCLLIRRRVFERIQTELKETPFSIRGGLSEDHSFFDRCRALGIRAFCCPAIESKHLKTVPVGLADFDHAETVLGPRVAAETL